MQLDCRAPDAEIKAHAGWGARTVKTYLSSVGKDSIYVDIWPTTQAAIDGEIEAELVSIAAAHGITPPTVKSLTGKTARMGCKQWWTRKLRAATLRANERTEHAAALVHKSGQCYVSDHAVKIKAERSKANRQTLEGLEVCNESGEAFNLQEIADKSVSNPALRRAELMTRCRGFEDAAEFMGHVGLFLTMTCPSRFHRVSHTGQHLKKWAGLSPKDGQIYLCKTWARIRAAWKKAGIAPYGFRVAEPHQDGTPHWHLLLFCAKEQTTQMLAIARHYASADSRHEQGARQHRFTVKRIDPSKGSATGYIAKYICKNIDGTKENGGLIDLDGQTDDAPSAADSSAGRVRTWAGTWGIRQFQQIGGPSVTVWRELRRLGKDAESLQLDLFEGPRKAASEGNWLMFWMVQGGPEVARQALTVKPLYEAKESKYGDMTPKIKGVQGFDVENECTEIEITRLVDWSIQRAGTADNNAMQYAWDEKLAFNRRNFEFMAVYRDSEFKRIGAAVTPRTGVNNCSENRFDFSSFDATDPNETAHLYQMGDQADPMTAFQDVWKDEKDNERHAAAWERFVKPTTGRPLDPHYAHLPNPTH